MPSLRRRMLVKTKPGARNMGTRVSSVLQHKGRRVVTVTAEETIPGVVKVLAENRIGAVPVIGEDGSLMGIISERDIIRGLSEFAESALRLTAGQLMTQDVKTCSAEDELVELMEVMTQQRIRHLPVIRDGALYGIVSIGDVVKQRLEEVRFEAEELRRYITSA
jgi:CBS domain-containing protein